MSDMCLTGGQWYVITYLMKTRIRNRDKESITLYQPRHAYKITNIRSNYTFISYPMKN